MISTVTWLLPFAIGAVAFAVTNLIARASHDPRGARLSSAPNF
jgi:hypothetical protein